MDLNLRFSLWFPVAAGLIGGSIAYAQQSGTVGTVFFTSKGDLTFPFTPPLRDGTPGTISNMTIGGGTPAPAAFTNVTAESIIGGDTSLGITGQAAASATAAGGAVAIAGAPGGSTSGTGGAATVAGGAGTAGNAVGGAAGVTAGAGQGTGAGAVASITGGASGGGSTGNGGVARVVGGAATSTAGTGGAAQVTGGAGTTTGAGGAVAITGGAGGNAAAGGAVTVTAGASTAAAGADVTVTAGAGNGTTNGGGSVNLVPGAAVSTGDPGTIKVNGNANLMCGTYFFTGTPAATNQVFYIANRPMIVTSLSAIFSVAAGGTSTLDVTKDTGTDAPAAGTALGQAAFNLAATANTIQNATPSATVATKTLAAGNRLAVKFNHAIQASAGVVVTACMAPL